jgi:hypothetical protein
MAVGGDAAQGGVAQVEQQAVEVVAHVLLGHRERGTFDQFLQAGLGHVDPFGGFELVDRGEIVRRQAGQAEPAASRLHGDLVALLGDGDLAAVGQGAHDLEQLARRDGGFTVLGIVDRGTRDHLDLEVGTGQRQLALAHLDQQVGQHRQGLPTLDHVDHLRQRLEQDLALQGKPHVNPLPLCWFWDGPMARNRS